MSRLLAMAYALVLTGCGTVTSGNMTAKAIWPQTASATSLGVSVGPGHTAIGRAADNAGAFAEILR